jgi:type VI secretion system secreted protein Hcp
MERENSIECLSFEDSVRTAREASSGMASGERTYEPVRIVKRIDKSSPLLAKALCNNEVIEATYKFYRPNPAGDGTTEHHFTVEIQEGRIASITRISPDVIDPASANAPPTEEVTFVFGYIRWSYEPDGIEHIDHWSQRT